MVMSTTVAIQPALKVGQRRNNNMPSGPWDKYKSDATDQGRGPWEKYGVSSSDANTKGEGLYRMLPSSLDGYTDTSKEIQVPYSRVKDVLNNGYKLHPDEEPRYQKDSTNEGQGP